MYEDANHRENLTTLPNLTVQRTAQKTVPPLTLHVRQTFLSEGNYEGNWSMEVDLQKLNLTLEQLLDIRNTLYQKILDGLAARGQEIKALPAYLRRPFNPLPGDAVVLDVAGTNIRAARLRCQGSNAKLLTSTVSDRETMQQANTPNKVDAHQFFAKQAALICSSLL